MHRPKKLSLPEYNAHHPVGTLIKTSLVDFPGRVAAAVFLCGCNLRCPYCYNTELISLSPKDCSAEWVTFDQIISHLQKRKNVLSGLAVSGGEALLSPYLAPLVTEAKQLGLKVKLDTNGLFPQKLKDLWLNPQTRPDYIAMDIKTVPEKYSLLGCSDSPEKTQAALSQTISLMQTYPKEEREWRTVLVPSLVKQEDISAMASLLPPDAAWYFAPFRNDHCLDPSYEKMQPYTESQMQQLVAFAKTLRPNATLR